MYATLKASSAITVHVLTSVILHTYRGQFDWQNLVSMNMRGRGDQSSSNEIACYNEVIFNTKDVLLGIF